MAHSLEPIKSGTRLRSWTCARVPHGYTGDATEAVIGQIERFAPGFRDQVVATATRTAPQMATYSANCVGGVYLCSSATPPVGGVHGMCDYNAAETALARL